MTQPPGRGSASSVRVAAIAVGATLLVAAVVVGAYLLGRSGDSTDSAEIASNEKVKTTTSTSTTEPETTTTEPPATTESPTTAAPIPAPLGDVRQASEGLFCRDLEAQGYSYAAAVDYWRVWGQPNRMDADRNGIPCETVYPRSDVVSYWPNTVYDLVPSYGYPSGLLCRDLSDRGASVYDALRYYIWEGYPSRMDADRNGIPCETVYPDAAEVWLFEF